MLYIMEFLFGFTEMILNTVKMNINSLFYR